MLQFGGTRHTKTRGNDLFILGRCGEEKLVSLWKEEGGRQKGGGKEGGGRIWGRL